MAEKSIRQLETEIEALQTELQIKRKEKELEELRRELPIKKKRKEVEELSQEWLELLKQEFPIKPFESFSRPRIDTGMVQVDPTTGEETYVSAGMLKMEEVQRAKKELEELEKEKGAPKREVEKQKERTEEQKREVDRYVHAPPSSYRPPQRDVAPTVQRQPYPAAYHLTGPGDLEAGRILRGEAAKEHAEADRRAMEREREEWRRTNL